MIPFTIFEDRSMRVNYNFSDFPVFIKSYQDLELYSSDYKAYRHWHPDIELSYTVSGTQDIFINGEYVHVDEGKCLFINSNRIHYGSSSKPNKCIFHVANIHPSLFSNSSNCVKNYISQRFSISNIDYIILSSSIPWQKKVIDCFLELIAEADKTEPSVLQLLARVNAICADICDNISPVKSSINENHMQIEFLKMVEYIHNNYHQKLTIDMIASSGAASLSKCHRLFKQFSKQSPNVFLTKFRIAKSIELLLDTELSVTQIALSCGFQTASYYTNIFKQQMNITPLQHRKLYRRDNQPIDKMPQNT